MQARPYDPSQSRFLAADEYEDADADLSLETNPLTQDRYAFAGGNPIGLIETDGHCIPDAPCDTYTPDQSEWKRDNQRDVAADRDQTEANGSVTPYSQHPTSYGAAEGDKGAGDAVKTPSGESRAQITRDAARRELQRQQEAEKDDASPAEDVACFVIGCTPLDFALNFTGPVKWAAKGGRLAIKGGPKLYRAIRGTDKAAGTAKPTPRIAGAAGSVRGIDELIETATTVRGRFARTADPGAIHVRRDPTTGAPTNYQIYGEDGLPVKRVDLTGRSHGGIQTPHVVDFQRNVNPTTGEVFVRPSRSVRPATPEEVPGG